jgi:hypothetical protein
MQDETYTHTATNINNDTNHTYIYKTRLIQHTHTVHNQHVQNPPNSDTHEHVDP